MPVKLLVVCFCMDLTSTHTIDAIAGTDDSEAHKCCSKAILVNARFVPSLLNPGDLNIWGRRKWLLSRARVSSRDCLRRPNWLSDSVLLFLANRQLDRRRHDFNAAGDVSNRLDYSTEIVREVDKNQLLLEGQ